MYVEAEKRRISPSTSTFVGERLKKKFFYARIAMTAG